MSKPHTLRNELPTLDATRLLVDGQQCDVAVTVVAGQVSGTLDRIVTQDDDGTLSTDYEVRIDGFREGGSLSGVHTDSHELLRDLSVVAALLADELERANEGGDDTSATHHVDHE
ncbi:hypothetical protein [Mycobacterium riyadhense]|uniref:hypothetical protein n=1 Tax=Mycobacterium riyadhense TaxID=486698 RepID=UPI00195E4ECF|nr:hypothetical protein [Mycobacterium riyadhense]